MTMLGGLPVLACPLPVSRQPAPKIAI